MHGRARNHSHGSQDSDNIGGGVRSLARVKGKDESFTKVILRLANRRSRGDLLDYLRSVGPNEELASAIEKVLEKRKHIQLRAAGR
jgi:predicted CopG family antitoxin